MRCQVRLLCLAATILLAVPAAAQVRSGTYVGNATDNRAIYVGFQPDVVIVDMDEAVTLLPDEAVIRTSTMLGDASKDMDNAAALAADKIQSLDAAGFTVGTHASVNGAGLTYHWVAFRAAPGKLKVGSYAGNGVDNTSITGVGFQPEYVIVMPASTANTTHRSSAMPGDITREFDALSFPDGIQALEADGFQVGTDARVNASGTTYSYAAWNASPGEVAVGVYTGDGIDGKTIPGLGFLPEEVLVHRSGASGPTHKPASTGVSVDRSLLFNNRLGETNNIQALLPDGFQVGDNTRVNALANTYYWVAFGPHAPRTNYRSIGTALDVSGTLSATQGSVVVTDLTATWQTANRGRGDRIGIGGTDYTVLAVDSETQLRLTTPFAAASGPYAYNISRQFGTLQAWEDCISTGVGCTYFPVAGGNLVADDRAEVGIAYKDGVFALTSLVTFEGSTTDATHTITLTADGGNRHNGTPGAGVVINGQDGPNRLRIQDNYVTVEWLEFVRVRGAINIAAINVGSITGGETGVVVQNVLVHDFFDAVNDVSGIRLTGGAGKSATVRNAMIWDGDSAGIEGDEITDALIIENSSVDGIPGSGIHARLSALTIRNTIVTSSMTSDFNVSGGSLGGSNNSSSDASAPGPNPQTGVTAASVFVAPNVNLHLRSGANVAVNSALDLSAFFSNDVDGESRLAVTWDRGADERDAAVTQPYHVHYRSIGTNAGVLYNTGNASVTAGSTTVTFGGGASLPTNLGQGDRIVIGGEELFLFSRDSSTQATLQEPAAINHSLDVYTITRAYNALQAWETARQGNLVAADHGEVGVAYNDGPFASGLTFDGSTTDATHFLRLTVAPGHRHNGTDVVGVAVDGLSTLAGEIYIWDDYVEVEGLVLKRTFGAGGAAIKVDGSNVLLQGLVIYSNESGIQMTGGGGGSLTVRNSFLHFNNGHGIRGNLASDSVVVDNCTLYSNGGNGIDEGAGTDFTVTNTISLANGAASFLIPGGAQSYNMSSDLTATGVGSLTNRIAGDQFVEIAFAPLNLHLKPTSEAIEAGTSLSSSFADDIDSDSRPRGSRWDMGADEYGVGAGLSFSSAANQTFFVGFASQFTATMTVTDDAAIATVTALKDIRIRIPADFPMMWDPTAASATLGGPAFFRVDPQVKAFEDSGRTVVLDVVSDFAPGDQITITGLKFYSFTAPAMAQSLELEVENDGTTSAYDDKTVAISPSVSPTLSSDSSQIFVVGSPPVPAVPFTVSEGTTPGIRSGQDIRVRIPAGLNMTWDSSIPTIVVTGAAAAKVSSGVFYEDLDGTLVIDVLTDFVPGDFVVVSGLEFMGFAGPPSTSSLELEVDNAGGVIDSDDKTISIDVASDVKVFAATATDSQVELHWVYPEFGACVRVLIMRDEGGFPTPFTGTLVHDDVCGVAGSAVSLVDPNSTFNGTEYFYSAFVDHGSSYTPGKFVTARPFDTSLEVKWAYSTGATSMAPPGLRIQSGFSFVYAVSNDSILHSLTGGDPGGDWPPAWTPYKLGAPAQTRPPVVNFNVGGPNGAAFLGSQDGQVYAIDAVTGTLKWKEPVASMVQAAPAGHFLAFNPSAYDLVLVGTRNSSGPNSFEALYVHDGTPRWSFTNSLAQGGNGQVMGIIGGGAAIDYTNQRAYFASRGKSGGSNKTLWCIGFNGTSATLLWSAPLGNIDGSPVLFGGRVYVGTNGGVLHALDATTGSIHWSLPLGDGAIKGFPFPRFGSNHLIVSTNNKIWSIEDTGTSGSVDPGWPVSAIPSPSIPLQVPGTQIVLVGSSDGKLYQLDVLVPLPPKSVQLGASAVGAPTMDLLKSMIYVGTERGVVYGVAFPLP